MASLLGRADPALVTAAARAGLANVPGDYSKQFGIMAAASKDIFTGIEKAFKQYEAGIKADKKALDIAISDLQKYGVGIENNADSKKFNGEMDKQVAIWNKSNGFKNDRQGLNEWERQNNKIMSKYKSNKTMLIEAVEAYQSDDSWTEGILLKPDGPQIIGFFKNLTTYAKNAGDKSGIYNERADKYMANNTGAAGDITPDQLWKHLGAKEGEMVKYHDPVTNEFAYITSVDGKVISKKSSEISKLIPRKAIKPETDIRTAINEQAKASNGVYSANDSQANQNWLESLIDNAIDGNEDALQYLMDQKYGGMDTSFIEALRNGKAEISPAIITSLMALEGYKGDQEADQPGHGLLDKNDFVSGTNYNTIVDGILYGEDTYELRRNLFADDIDARAFRPAIEQGGKAKGEQVDYGMAMPKLLGGQHRSNETVRDQANKLFTYEKGRMIVMNDGNYIVIEPGKTFKSTDEDDEGTIFTLQDIWDNNAMPSGLLPAATPAATPAIDPEASKLINKGKPKFSVGDTIASEDYTAFEDKTGNLVSGEKLTIVGINKDGTFQTQKEDGTIVSIPSWNLGKTTPSTKPIEDIITNSGLEGITEEKSGKYIRYFNYIGNDINAARTALSQAKSITGIDKAFIKYENNDKQISPEAYAKLKDKSNATIKVQLGVGKKSIVQEDVEVSKTPKIVTEEVTEVTEEVATEEIDYDNLTEQQKKDMNILSEVEIHDTTEEVVTEEVEYGIDNPHEMFGNINSFGDRMIGLDGEWVKIGSKKYFKSLGIKSKKGKAFVQGEGVMEKVSDIASDHGFNVRQLLNIFRNESGFNTRGRNPKGGATGLIQFFKDPGKSYKTIDGVKYELDDIREMSVLEQLDLVDAYFTENHKKGGHPYITVALPKAHNMSMDEIIATPSDSIAKQNPPWRNSEGNVTKRSIIAYGEKKA